ncbi:MAG: flagellar hook-length control protein FliK [Rhodospirillales bacterium]|nr:MAG: flagellar hook-length control protein FliK [Rhodospirillales bacterium]
MSDLSLLLAAPDTRSSGQPVAADKRQPGTGEALGGLAVSFQALLQHSATPIHVSQQADLAAAIGRADSTRAGTADRGVERQPDRPSDRPSDRPTARDRAGTEPGAAPRPDAYGAGRSAMSAATADRRSPSVEADTTTRPAAVPIGHSAGREPPATAPGLAGFAASHTAGALSGGQTSTDLTAAALLAARTAPLPGPLATAQQPGLAMAVGGDAGVAGQSTPTTQSALLSAALVAAGVPGGRIDVTLARHGDAAMPPAATALAPAAVLAVGENVRGPVLSTPGTISAAGGEGATSLAFQALAAGSGNSATGSAQTALGTLSAMTGTAAEAGAAFAPVPVPSTASVTASATGVGAAAGTATAAPTALSDGPGLGATATAPVDTAGGRSEAVLMRAQPFAQRAVSDQVSVHITKAVREGSDQIEIKLRPASLGRVDVRLELGADGRVLATVTADTRQTLELLRADARGLERALQDAGLQADSGSLSFNLRGDGGRPDSEAPGKHRTAIAEGAADDGDKPVTAAATIAERSATRPGGIDIHA